MKVGEIVCGGGGGGEGVVCVDDGVGIQFKMYLAAPCDDYIAERRLN